MRLIISIALFFTNSLLFAQEGKLYTIKQNGKHFKSIEFDVKKNTLYTNIIPDFEASSLNIEISNNHNFEKAYFILGNDEKRMLNLDNEQTQIVQESAARINSQSSALIISNSSFKNFSFYTANIEGRIRINLLYASPLKSSYLKDKKKRTDSIDCSIAPESIDQEIWRTGLPDPAGNPTPTTVKHIILHHAAGNNTDTQYLATVRNYYMLHTQTNGWDDIGYNYLVAPNGDIYNGRDGFQYGDDNVIGAHLCARNANTMGICLLGNYHNTGYLPSDTAIASINKLIVWKMHKERLSNPYDSSLHPINNPEWYLGVVAGHREGCPTGYTSCPGEQYFQQINDRVKANVAIALSNCIPLSSSTLKFNEALIYPNPLNARYLNVVFYEKIHSIKVYNTQGKLLKNIENIEGYRYELENEYTQEGLILLEINGQHRYKIIVNERY